MFDIILFFFASLNAAWDQIENLWIPLTNMSLNRSSWIPFSAFHRLFVPRPVIITNTLSTTSSSYSTFFFSSYFFMFIFFIFWWTFFILFSFSLIPFFHPLLLLPSLSCHTHEHPLILLFLLIPIASSHIDQYNIPPPSIILLYSSFLLLILSI